MDKKHVSKQEEHLINYIKKIESQNKSVFVFLMSIVFFLSLAALVITTPVIAYVVLILGGGLSFGLKSNKFIKKKLFNYFEKVKKAEENHNNNYTGLNTHFVINNNYKPKEKPMNCGIKPKSRKKVKILTKKRK